MELDEPGPWDRTRRGRSREARAGAAATAAIAAIAVIAVLAAIAAAGACAPRRPCEIVPRHEPTGAPLLWRVQRPGGAPLWLFGTFHHERAPVPPAALAALEAAPQFLSELGDATPDPERFFAWARIPRGKGLESLLPTSDWWDLRDALRGVVDEEPLKRARPWFAMTRLTAAMAPSPGPVMDTVLVQRARALGKPVDALETWDEQLAALDAAITVADLQEAIRARKTMRCSIERQLAVYAAGDLAAIEQSIGASLREELLAPRNRRWLPRLERYLAARGAFVAVGVNHLAGEDGLPALLARAGYSVERVGAAGAAGAAGAGP